MCTAPPKTSGYSFSLQPSQVHIPRPPTRCHSQCCPLQTACPHISLWDPNMEPQVLPYLWFVWGWWCPGWTACYFPLHTPPHAQCIFAGDLSPYSQRHRMFQSCRGKSTGCFFFAPEQQQTQFFNMNWLKAFSCKPCKPYYLLPNVIICTQLLSV